MITRNAAVPPGFFARTPPPFRSPGLHLLKRPTYAGTKDGRMQGGRSGGDIAAALRSKPLRKSPEPFGPAATLCSQRVLPPGSPAVLGELTPHFIGKSAFIGCGILLRAAGRQPGATRWLCVGTPLLPAMSLSAWRRCPRASRRGEEILRKAETGLRVRDPRTGSRNGTAGVPPTGAERRGGWPPCCPMIRSARNTKSPPKHPLEFFRRRRMPPRAGEPAAGFKVFEGQNGGAGHGPGRGWCTRRVSREWSGRSALPSRPSPARCRRW